MQGKVVGNSLVIMDSFALPVQGTETRVNAANEANEYMVEYIDKSEKARRRRCFSLSHPNSWPGWSPRERHRLVPLASGVRLLVVWHRREHADEQPEVPGPLRRRRGALALASLSFLS